MASQVKCRRCGATFSSNRTRCPNCGTRRVVQSARVPAGTPGTIKGTAASQKVRANAKWQMAFGLVLVASVLLSVIVMVSTNLNGLDTGKVRPTPTPYSELQNQEGDPLEGLGMPMIESAPTPEPTPAPQVEAIRIMLYTRDITDEKAWPTVSLSKDKSEDGTPYQMNITATIIPMDIENPTVTWEVSDPEVLHIEPLGDNPNGILAYQVGTKAGGVELTATCNGFSQSCRIYCRE